MRILIISHDANLGKILRGLLEGDGHVPHFMQSKEVTRQMIPSFKEDFDVLIIDRNIEDESGIALSGDLRALGIKIPILMAVDKFKMTDKVDALKAGVDEVALRPSDAERWVNLARDFIKRLPLPASASQGTEEVVLLESTHEALRGNKSIHLTAKEFSILEFLMNRAGRIVTRKEIADSLWGLEAGLFSNLIDVHVKNLRKKLNGKGSEIIETVRGVGFRWRSRRP